MGAVLADHDCEPSAADSGPSDSGVGAPDALERALDRLRLEGAIFLHGRFTEAWSYRSMTGPDTARVLHPGADTVVLFHVVARGTLWVAGHDDVRHWARAGDVIVLPYADQHVMGGVEDADVVSLESILEMPPWTQMPVIRHGAAGERTDIVCGYLHSTDPLFDPRLRVFPPVFVVRPEGAAAQWVQANIDYAMEQAAAAPGAVPTRLPELLLVEMLKLHLATAPAVDVGLMAALRDPVLAPALAAIHSAPAHKWTVADLARAALVSKSLLDARFRQTLGRSPIRYLTDWRMHLAQDLLATTDLGIVTVAHRVGYDAEEAFSRAFKRALGCAPSVWRVRRSTAAR